MTNPAQAALISEIDRNGGRWIFGEVCVERVVQGYEIRHREDRDRPVDLLETVEIHELRHLAQFTAAGVFRPLRGMPTLRCGWRASAADSTALRTALDHLYPGGIADWWSFNFNCGRPTPYREYAERQSGMYRVAQRLDDAAVADVIRACCSPQQCIRRRLWTLDGVAEDAVECKSVIPCFEPCALTLEFARRAYRMLQQPLAAFQWNRAEAETLLSALELAVKHPSGEGREGDSADPLNSRRIQWTIHRLRRVISREEPSKITDG